MPILVKSGTIISAALLIGATAIRPSSAQYEGPRGHYRSEASFTRAINGTPCGAHCRMRRKGNGRVTMPTKRNDMN
jgi:hypothetical protein